MIKIHKPHETLIFEDSEELEEILNSEGYQFQVRHDLLAPKNEILVVETLRDRGHKFAILDNNFNLVTSRRTNWDGFHPKWGEVNDRSKLCTTAEITSELITIAEAYYDRLYIDPNAMCLRGYCHHGKNSMIPYKDRPDDVFKYPINILERYDTKVNWDYKGYTSLYRDLYDIKYTNVYPYQGKPVLSAFCVELLDNGTLRLEYHKGGKMRMNGKKFDWINSPKDLKPSFINWCIYEGPYGHPKGLKKEDLGKEKRGPLECTLTTVAAFFAIPFMNI